MGYVQFLMSGIIMLGLATSLQAEKVRCAVLGHLNYEDGYAKRLAKAGVTYDRLDGTALLKKSYSDLLKYKAIFIALGIDDEGIKKEEYHRKLDLYVRSGGVLVLEQKAQFGLGQFKLAQEILAKEFRFTHEAKSWFGELAQGKAIAYGGNVITQERMPKLTVQAESEGKPIMSFGAHGRGFVFYNGVSSSYAVHLSQDNSDYVQMVDGTIRWALSRETQRELPEFDQKVAKILKNDPNLPPDKDWIWNMRMISMKIPKHADEETLIRQALPFQQQGVNVMMDHGSMQFVPNLPETEAQWKLQVDFDSAEIFTRAMHKAGLRVFHHTTTTWVPIEAMKVPGYDFFSRDIRTGKVALFEGTTEENQAAFADMNDPQWRSIVFPRMKEYMKRVRPDAFMSDEVQWLPTEYAGGTDRGSRAKFRKQYGFDYPSGSELGNWNSPKWRAFIKFKYDSGGNFYRDLNALLREANPNAYVSGCLAGISKPWRKTWAIGNESWLSGVSVVFFEAQEQGPPPPMSPYDGTGHLYATLWPGYCREMALFNAAAEMQNTVTYTLGYPQTYQVENSELFYGWAQASLMGHRYWMNDYQFEPQWYMWDAEHEKDIIRPKWIGDVGIFFPEYNRDYRTDELMAFKDWAGFGESLADNAIQFDQLMRWHLEGNHLDRFKLIVLPSEYFLSPEMSKNLEQFVQRGGKLIVTGDTAVNDILNEKINDGGQFDKLLGIDKREAWVNGPFTVTLNKDVAEVPAGGYQFVNGYERIKPAKGATVLARIDNGDDPAIISHRVGKGYVIYFTGRVATPAYQAQWWNLDPKFFRRTADVKTRENLATLVDRMLDGKRRVKFMGLPKDVMTHAHDTYGHGIDQPRRTIHLLESSGGFKDGDPWPTKGRTVNFVPMEKRTAGKPIVVELRDIAGVKNVKLISPDWKGERTLKAEYSKDSDTYKITIDPKLLGRYSIIILEYKPLDSDKTLKSI